MLSVFSVLSLSLSHALFPFYGSFQSASLLPPLFFLSPSTPACLIISLRSSVSLSVLIPSSNISPPSLLRFHTLTFFVSDSSSSPAYSFTPSLIFISNLSFEDFYQGLSDLYSLLHCGKTALQKCWIYCIVFIVVLKESLNLDCNLDILTGTQIQP